jgi:hypothetical protein
VDVAHVLDDGGGRELAYVAVSRARHASHVYTTARDVRDAAQRLEWSWDDERREQWLLDRQRAAERVDALRAERQRLIAMIPPDVGDQLARLRRERAALERDLADLGAGAGRWRNTPVGDAHDQLLLVRAAHRAAERSAEATGVLGRRRARRDLEASIPTLALSEAGWRQACEPLARDLVGRLFTIVAEIGRLETGQQARADFIDANTELMGRIIELGQAMKVQRAEARGGATAERGWSSPNANPALGSSVSEKRDAPATTVFGPDI